MTNTRDIDVAKKRLHVKIFSHVFSPCGKYIVVSDNFGRIYLFDFHVALQKEHSDDIHHAFYSFQAQDCPIYSLVTTESHLICSGNDIIKAWNWDVIVKKSSIIAWEIKIPVKYKFDVPETNSLVIADKESGMELFAGCGDNNIYHFDLAEGRCINTLEGHTDYVHQVVCSPHTFDLLSCSEDGTAKLWDLRAKSVIHSIEPQNNENCSRPHMGKWIGCTSLSRNNDWIVCGGGPHLSLWHLKSLECTVVYEIPAVTHDVMLHEERVIGACSDGSIHHWMLNGENLCLVPSSCKILYNLAINKTNGQAILGAAGQGPNIDICTNFGYKAFSMVI